MSREPLLRGWKRVPVAEIIQPRGRISKFGRGAAGPRARPPSSLTQRRGDHTETRSISSHRAAENAEVLRAQRVGSGSVALRRPRGVFRGPVMWWFAPGGSGFAAWSLLRPAGSPAG